MCSVVEAATIKLMKLKKMPAGIAHCAMDKKRIWFALHSAFNVDSRNEDDDDDDDDDHANNRRQRQ